MSEKIITPFEEIKLIGELMKKNINTIDVFLPLRTRYSLRGSDYAYFLEIGNISLRRISDEKIIFFICSPAVIIFTSFFNLSEDCYVEAETGSYLSSLSVMNILDENIKNIHLLFNIQSYTTMLFFQRDGMCNNKSVYSQIRECLIQLWSLPEDVRLKLSLYKFILHQNDISRSSVNNVIKALNKGGYIYTFRGKLISMNNLPRKF